MSWFSKIFRRTGKDGTPKSRDTSNVPVAGDNPIQRVEDDTLGRDRVARSFVRQVLAVDAKEGLVVGVLGNWGSGKTSFINLARDEFRLADVPVLDFNPWMFSGAQQLVEWFFVELSAQLRIRDGFAAVGREMEEYGEILSGMAWVPLVGSWIERVRRVTAILSRLLQRRKEGVAGRRGRLQKALAGLSKPIVVVLDDIDRLSTLEIRDVFKLVRLTASFPNIIYLVAFDRGRVEKALAEDGVPGRDYLEKILQVTVDLPAIPDHVLNRQILSAIDTALATVETPGPFDEQVWPDVFMEIIRPLIRNMRDVRRYAVAIHGAVVALDGQIALPDVLALEAIRIFLPDVFARLHSSVEALTTTFGLSDPGRDETRLKSKIDGLINDTGVPGKVGRDMVERLFPAAERHIGGSHYGSDWKSDWLKARRVAHEDILCLYLERVAGKGLQAFTNAEQAWARMTDRDALNDYLRSLDREQLQDVIASLEIYEKQFAAEHVVPSVIVLLNLLPEMPERRGGMFDLGSRFVVPRITYRLLRILNPAAAEGAVRQILPELKALSSKLVLIRQVGHRAGPGHRLVSEMAAADFEQAWRDEVRATSVNHLVKETDPLQVLLITKREGLESEPALKVHAAPELTLAILRAARSETTSQTIGSRAVRRAPRLGWDALVELYGDEQTLKDRLESLKAAGPIGADDLLVLAEKYLRGWRPDGFGDD